MVQGIRSLQKLAIFFQGLTLGAEGGGLVRGTLRYMLITARRIKRERRARRSCMTSEK